MKQFHLLLLLDSRAREDKGWVVRMKDGSEDEEWQQISGWRKFFVGLAGG